MKQSVIGLAGHIDHGKTTLVKALTGIDTDSLQEEKSRGMTIDIGFAFMSENITLIDVPGHEKFVKNMMAGVSGIDIALLVIAADDGIMPQTREHFEILNLLDIKKAVIIINKTDLVDSDWLDLVELEINELIFGTFMEKSRIFHVSAETGSGIIELKNTLFKMCEIHTEKKDRGIFRQHVDRAFSVKGYGTVITGTVNSGILNIGDNVEVLPGNIVSKVRGLQSHGNDVKVIKIGDRAAINLKNIDKKDIARGSQLATPGYLTEVKQIGVELRLLSSAKKHLIQNQRIRVHLGTQEAMGRVALIGQKKIEPGETIPALIRLESSLVAAKGDRFIIRNYSPVITIGGGEVLEILIKDKWNITKENIKTLFSSDYSQQFIYMVKQEMYRPMTMKKLELRLGISEKQIQKWVEKEDSLFWLHHNNKKWLLSIEQWGIIKEKIKIYLKEYHEKYPLKMGAQKEEIRQQLNCETSILDALLQNMHNEKDVIQRSEMWSLSSFSVNLEDGDKVIQTKIIKILNKQGFTSSSLEELSVNTGYQKEKLVRILNVSEQEGRILRISGKLIFTNENFIELKKKVISHFVLNDELSIADFKDLAKTSRKYAVPLLEYFDQKKITYRDGNNRKLI